ncbi:MAG: IS66 family transposase [gamma proteobacterium symbiont of Taylorina sp.]|nr:IS66 family transposase [gamma proteobacterium symbiont of Taylorina sp.]
MHVEQQLNGFQGTLLSDGYCAYDKFARNNPDVTLAQCWTHTRRYFVKSQEIEPQATEQALDFMGTLYQHPTSKVEELIPRLWKEKFSSNPLLSDLETASKTVSV